MRQRRSRKSIQRIRRRRTLICISTQRSKSNKINAILRHTNNLKSWDIEDQKKLNEKAWPSKKEAECKKQNLENTTLIE